MSRFHQRTYVVTLPIPIAIGEPDSPPPLFDYLEEDDDGPHADDAVLFFGLPGVDGANDVCGVS